MKEAPPKGPPPASLDGLEGHGYAVVESLPSLGKGRTCTGVFLADPDHRAALEALVAERRRAPFRGVVHNRHRSAEATLEVELQRVEPTNDRVLVEFTAPNVPYDLAG